jgi:Trk-type K+ transport system membrane component
MQPSIIQTLIGFITLFTGSLFVGAFILALFGVNPNNVHPNFDYYEAFGIAMSSISNVGPGMGYYGPVHSWAILNPYAKWMCSFLMLIGFTGAACMSWIFNHSMFQAIFHGLFGWLYICYKSFWYVVTNF